MQRKLSKSRYLVPIVMVWAALFYLVACNSGSSEGPSAGLSQTATLTSSHITANYAFIPNHGEASVSKVELLSATAVARYWTAPRLGDEVDIYGDASAANTIDPRAWRTSRIAMDPQGNAWVLNTAADADRYPSGGPPLQGTVVRIQGNTDGLATTNADHAAPLAFGNDEAVQVFPVGIVGDIPRAIAIDGDGNIWIGFYWGGYFQKYTYNGSDLLPEGDPVYPLAGAIAPYDVVIDSEGILWFSSRNSTPAKSHNIGVYSFDTAGEPPVMTRHTTFNPYAVLLDEARGVLWVSEYITEAGNLHDIALASPHDVNSRPIAGANELRGMTLDRDGYLWLADSNNHRVLQFDPDDGALGALTGKIYECEKVRPVGLGLDAQGYIWAIMRDDTAFRVPNDPNGGFIEQFDPAANPPTMNLVQVGLLPYAYGNFVIEEEEELCPFDDTAWAYGGDRATANNTISGSNNWGWTNSFETTDEFPIEMDLIAGAGQNILDNGTVVGTVSVAYDGECVTVTYAIDPNLEPEHTLLEAHLWVGDTPLPLDRRGNPTAAPGQLGVSPEIAVDGLSAVAEVCGIEEDFWVAAHAVVGWMDECEEEMEPIM
jgi:streptogramin lyase